MMWWIAEKLIHTKQARLSATPNLHIEFAQQKYSWHKHIRESNHRPNNLRESGCKVWKMEKGEAVSWIKRLILYGFFDEFARFCLAREEFVLLGILIVEFVQCSSRRKYRNRIHVKSLYKIWIWKIWNEGRQRENYRPLYRYRTPTDLFRFAFVLQCTMHEGTDNTKWRLCGERSALLQLVQFLFGFQHRNAPAGLDRKSVVLFMQPSVYLITFIYSKKWRWCFCGSTVDPELLGKVSNWINNMHAVRWCARKIECILRWRFACLFNPFECVCIHSANGNHCHWQSWTKWVRDLEHKYVCFTFTKLISLVSRYVVDDDVVLDSSHQTK